MKALKVTFLTIAVFLFANVGAQCINGTKSYPIYKSGAKLVSELDGQGKEIVRIEYDLVFSKKETFRNLSDDWEYTFVAFADDGVKDVDVKVYEYDDLLEEWNVVEEDTSVESYAMISYKPTTAGQYKIEVIAYEFHEGYTAARYGLIVYHD